MNGLNFSWAKMAGSAHTKLKITIKISLLEHEHDKSQRRWLLDLIIMGYRHPNKK